MADYNPYQGDEARNPFKPIDYAARLNRLKTVQPENTAAPSYRAGMPYANRLSPARAFPQAAASAPAPVYSADPHAPGSRQSPAPVQAADVSYQRANVLNSRSMTNPGVNPAPMVSPGAMTYTPFPDELPARQEPRPVPESNPYTQEQISFFPTAQRGSAYTPGLFAQPPAGQSAPAGNTIFTDEISSFFGSAPQAAEIPGGAFAPYSAPAAPAVQPDFRASGGNAGMPYAPPASNPPAAAPYSAAATPYAGGNVSPASAQTGAPVPPPVVPAPAGHAAYGSAAGAFTRTAPTVPVQPVHEQTMPRQPVSWTAPQQPVYTVPPAPAEHKRRYQPRPEEPAPIPVVPQRRRFTGGPSTQPPQNYAGNQNFPVYDYTPEQPARELQEEAPPQASREPAPAEEVVRAERKPEKERTPLTPLKLISTLVLVAVLAFAGIRISDYMNRTSGSQKPTGGISVQALPAGQTYVPTQPNLTAVIPTPTPTPAIPLYDPVAQGNTGSVVVEAGETAVPDQTLSSTRSRQSYYPKNQMQIVQESIRPLHEANSYVIGRLVIPGLLDQVVMQKDNTYYLNHDSTESYSSAGAVFADVNCSLKTPPENLLLRGNSAEEGMVFAPLNRCMTEQSAMGAARTATLTTLYEEERWLLFAAIRADNSSASPNYFAFASHPTFATDAEMLDYVQSAMARSVCTFGVSVAPSDRLLTLATISDNDTCVILMYRMARDGEF